MSDCGICCEKFNLKNHKRVDCPFCDFTSCRSCVQTYLTGTSNDPHCMSCKKEWNREFLDQSCTKVWRNNDYKTHRETILLEREKCYLPQAQELVVRERQKRETVKMIETIKIEIAKQRQLQWELENQMHRLNNGHDVGQGSSERRTFVRKCPVENCKGFLSIQWNCEICENKICKDCNEIKGEDHVCDPKNVETVALLAKDTKPCPQCGTMIFKISGCSQMWCPGCHVAFNWNTLRIETGVIHNPHYYDFQRQVGGGRMARNPGDIPCGGLPSVNELYNFMLPGQGLTYRRYNTGQNLTDVQQSLLRYHRTVSHIQNFELIHQYRHEPADNTRYRVQYLMDELSEENWKKILQQGEKNREKKRDMANILRMFSDTSSDLFRQMIQGEIDTQAFNDISGRLRTYTNSTFETIHKRYNCVTPYVDQNWNYTTKRYKGDESNLM